jgi:type I site-specific restriction endonuclease
VGGEPVSRIESRSDVLVSHNGKPLAVLELKRPGQALTESDEKQGLSYAALLHPPPPLVVVTNGSDTRILDSYSGLA